MPKLSIVIPAFNEQSKIGRDIWAADQFLTSQGLSGEIIIIDDGSRDDTAKTAENAARTIQAECVIESLKEHRGKGFAVRTGILKSRGDLVGFSDSGCCIPYEEMKLGINLISSGQCQIAHGSRKLANCHIQQSQSLYRQLCSKIFHWFLIHDIKRLGNLTDTQCGFKVYRGYIARELYSSSQIDGFMFDIEIVLLALSKGYPILEFPVSWRCDPDSRLKPLHESWHVFRDLIELKKHFGKFIADNTL